MRSMNSVIVSESQRFAARWGFLSWDIFSQFFCRMSRAQTYRSWSRLTTSGHFVKSKSDSQILFLSDNSRRKFFGLAARPSRLPTYVEHDSALARVLLTLQSYGLIDRYWLEDELMRNPTDAFVVLGADKIHRLPDLVFDLKTETQTLRCALEIERTMKSQSRYDRIAMSYFSYSRISLVLFGCNGLATEGAIKRSFQGSGSSVKRLVPGLFQLDEFKNESLKSRIRFQDREHSVQGFIELVTKKKLGEPISKRDLNETAVSFRKADFKESA